MLRGRLASLRGERDPAICLYNGAAEQFKALEMPLYEAATRFRLSELSSGEEAAGLVRSAIDWCQSQQVKNPEALMRMALP